MKPAAGLAAPAHTGHDVSVERNLIIDVGMHDGADSAFYLAKGFDVVAVEANPGLCSLAESRFSEEIADGRFRLIASAIAETRGTVKLAISDSMDIWSSLSHDFVARNQEIGVEYRYVDVEAVRLEDVLAQVGIPYYLKIDIEGFDMVALRALHNVSGRPEYVSVESNVASNHAPFDLVFDELAELWTLGYRSFQYVNQRTTPTIRMPKPSREGRYVDARFAGHESGPFGADLSGRWLSLRQALAWAQVLRLRQNVGGFGGRWRSSPAGRVYARARQRLLGREHSWYDLHARLVPAAAPAPGRSERYLPAENSRSK